jgi:hypothetical protein
MSAAAQPIEPRPPAKYPPGGFLTLVVKTTAPLVHLWEERHCPECGRLNPHHEKACWLKLVE